MTLPPINEVLASLETSLSTQQQVILQAPPGAGKSTYLPLKLLTHPRFLGKKILMLEPRRLAAKNIARFIAKQLGESVGEQVGYRVKGEHQVGPNTRLEIITEGILTRMLQQDPELADVGLVIFDEYHERSIHADTALAFCLEIQEGYNEQLRLLLMSATLDSEQLTQLLPQAHVIQSQGRCFDVSTHYRPKNNRAPLAPQVAQLVNEAIAQYQGNILVFLAGASEIHKVQSLLTDIDDAIDVFPLYGQLNNQQQDSAIAASQHGRRKVVLATNIAETSITIEGISLVIDSGMVNRAVFDRHNGVTKLTKEQISQASAIQRAGRAGRVQAGHCWRMWPKEQQSRLAKYDVPEIAQSDLLPLALELAKWGVCDVNQLQWLTPPPSHNLLQARQLLQAMGAIDEHYQLTSHGRAIHQFTSSPRLAHMMLFAQQHQWGATAALIAAMLEHTKLLSNHIDISQQVNVLAHNKQRATQCALLIQQAKKYLRTLRADWRDINSEHTAILLAQAYPDRIAKRRHHSQRFQLANGFGAALEDDTHLEGEFIVIADLMNFSAQQQGRIFLAAPLDIVQLQQLSPHLFHHHDLLKWDNQQDKVQAHTQLKLNQLVISQKPLTHIDVTMLNSALCEGIRAKGLTYFNFSKSQLQLLQRLRTAYYNEPEQWPDFSEEALLADLDNWLVPFFNGAKKLDHLKRINMTDALLSRLDWQAQQQLNALYPTHYRLNSGVNVALDYSNIEQVKLSVRLQALFGTLTTPTIGSNKLALLIEMLSPAQRPIQLTKDLAGFWQGSYQAVKKEMKGRYPKHRWPDDPLSAQSK